MKREVWRAMLAFGLLLLSPTARAAQVVGLHDSYPDVLVATRGLMVAGSTVRGIEFYSNEDFERIADLIG